MPANQNIASCKKRPIIKHKIQMYFSEYCSVTSNCKVSPCTFSTRCMHGQKRACTHKQRVHEPEVMARIEKPGCSFFCNDKYLIGSFMGQTLTLVPRSDFMQ